MKNILIIGIVLIATSVFGYDFLFQPNQLTRSQDPFKILDRVMRFDDRAVSYDKEKNLYYRDYEGVRYYCLDGSIGETDEEVAARLQREEAEYFAKIAEIAPQASIFRWVLRKHFEEGAETNRTITEDAVSRYFIQRRITGTGEATDASDAILLQTGFEAIKAITEDGTSWSLRWDLIPEI